MTQKTTVRESVIASAVASVTEVVARVRRRSAHVSPYKKALNQANNAAMKLLSDSSDSAIRSWASRILIKTLGTKALKLSDTNISEIRTVVTLLADISVYDAEKINSVLIEAARYSINNSQDQMQALLGRLKLLASKEKLSLQQLMQNKIGNQLLLDMNNDSETHQKRVDTRGGLR